MKKKTEIERFLSKITKSEDGCWVWQAVVTPPGYGRFYSSLKKGNVYSHRFSYVYYKGEIPQGLEIDHLCRNRRCCNPDHLEAVAHVVNVNRGRVKTNPRPRKTHCIRGHEYTDDNSYWAGTSRLCRACIKIRQKPYDSAAAMSRYYSQTNPTKRGRYKPRQRRNNDAH